MRVALDEEPVHNTGHVIGRQNVLSAVKDHVHCFSGYTKV